MQLGNLRLLAVIAGISLSLSACGFKGPLQTKPQAQENQQTQSNSASESSSEKKE